jgi:hypothetical protein
MPLLAAKPTTSYRMAGIRNSTVPEMMIERFRLGPSVKVHCELAAEAA